MVSVNSGLSIPCGSSGLGSVIAIIGAGIGMRLTNKPKTTETADIIIEQEVKEVKTRYLVKLGEFDYAIVTPEFVKPTSNMIPIKVSK